MRIGFTGTQGEMTMPQKVSLFHHLCDEFDKGARWMHNGDCIGADAYAAGLWRGIGGKIHLHPPMISRKRVYVVAECVEREKPYIVRNHDIVNRSFSMIACPKEHDEVMRSGTWATIRFAKRVGKPVLIIYPDGTTNEG